MSITLKEFLKNSNPLQSYGQNSNLSPSKPPYVHLGGLTPRKIRYFYRMAYGLMLNESVAHHTKSFIIKARPVFSHEVAAKKVLLPAGTLNDRNE